MLSLALGATLLSVGLLSQSLWGSTLPGCDAGGGSASSCDQVLSSRYSEVFHVPVSLLAVLLYGAVFFVIDGLELRPRDNPSAPRWAWPMLVFAGASAMGAALWFVFVQAVLVKAFCVYCSATHALGATLALLLITAAWSRMSRRLWITCLLLGLLGTATLALAQHLGPAPRTMRVQQLGGVPDIDTGPGPDRTISILAGRVRLKPHDYPTLGSPDAPHIVVYLYDYTCKHCREMSRVLRETQQRYGDQLAIVLLPVPLDSACNPRITSTKTVHAGACELAKLTMGLWRIEPETLPAVHERLMRDPMAPTPEAAVNQLRKIVRPESLVAARYDPWPAEQIARNVRLLELTGSGAIPRLIMGSIVISSRPTTAQELFDLLEKETSLRPTASVPERR